MKRSLPDPLLTTVEIIETWLPKQIDTAAFGEASFCIRLTISGAQGGDWNCLVHGEGLVVVPFNRMAGHQDDLDIWVRLSVNDFRALFFGDVDLPIPLIISEDFAPLFVPLPEDLEAFKNLEGRIRFELLGRRHRRFAVDVSFGERGMRAGRPRSSICVDAGAYERLIQGKQNPLEAFMTEQVRVEGDRGFALQVAVLCASRRR